jgi:tRNA A-37 threonylcarbamoyl transferase component Bud32
MSDAPSPTIIGRYEVLALLGQGGMANVYLATPRDVAGGPALVVIKQIRPELAADPELRSLFFDEARIAARLRHPNVVTTYEIVEQDGQYSMVMEYLEGQTLAEMLNRVGRAQFPLEENLWILTQVLAGLHHGHELRAADGTLAGVVHQDVSPSNVFVTYDGVVKLLDFGIARPAGPAPKGSVKGKLGYAAPEQFLSRSVDARADVYAAGVMLWEMIAGRRRGNGETPTSTRETRLAGLETRIRDVRPDVPEALAELVDGATAVDPRARFSTAAELQHGLERFLASRPRRVGAREVGALLWVHFRDDRLQRRAQIAERLSGTGPSVNLTGGRVPSAAHAAMVPTVRLEPRRAMLAAAVIAGAGMAGVVTALVRGPSRNENPPAIAGPPPVHSIVLERTEPPRPRPGTLTLPPMHAEPHPVPLPLDQASPRPRPRPAAPRPRLAERAAPVPHDDRPRELTPPPFERRRSVEPGMDLARPQPAAIHRQLDEKDPYSP